MSVLRCEKLRKAFDGVVALSGLDVELPASGIVAVVGPNGAGKTTLLNVLTGFVRADSGRAWFGRCDLTRLAPHQIVRCGISRTFQDVRLVRRISVLENVVLARPRQPGEALVGALLRLGGREETNNRRAGARCLEVVGLAGKAGELAGTLSYGEQKLVTLARCFAAEARVLLLDEPVAGVHPELVAHILDVLRVAGKEERLIVFVEHDLAAVRQVADRVIVMDDGRIIADGKPAEVLERPDIMEAYVA